MIKPETRRELQSVISELKEMTYYVQRTNLDLRVALALSDAVKLLEAALRENAA
jgi:hypothetical protein